ncbi:MULTISPECIES: type II toxin-antitoxin system Phd/YefM family antitoxin [Roseofilum]|uniref:Type II toxin-antitoxin system prevent-host-death family antitoxin n=2 Tax=Roseofilum TaxID=1233426 RepID=A0ABT7BB49_9CYAN|nr:MULTISPECIES: prevent-host-death protein [Roseofilum]MDJ1168024.1 type II toxin-antitoxin system prevent-host-death family antitoxin [Roseofilum acuticapitatum BLCC-M154]MDJ1176398.1 type II toxin-antitoxin system prevent-host-death family antitoxin [Roseofilum capinflatum BLCC-M114]
MENIDINQALPKIAELLEMAFSGQEVVITNHKDQQIKIAPLSASRPPRFGCDRERVILSDDFDVPLDDFQDYS